MKVTRILHASVNTAGAVEETAAFYRDLLGLAEAPRPEMPGVPGQWFAVADAQVHLIGRPESERPLDPSRHHVAFAVDDLAAALAELEATGHPVIAVGPRDSGPPSQVFVTDPAGNVVELQQG